MCAFASRCSERKSTGISTGGPLKARREPDRAGSLLLVYLASMITGDVIAYLIGLRIERSVRPSLPAFLAMCFLFLWSPGCLPSASCSRRRRFDSVVAAGASTATRRASIRRRLRGVPPGSPQGVPQDRHAQGQKPLLIKVMLLAQNPRGPGRASGGSSGHGRCNERTEWSCRHWRWRRSFWRSAAARRISA
jgi:hypothetical protein